MIIVYYVYKKPIIIIEHRSRHKFQMCKEDGFTNLKFDYTWQHDLLTKLGFIKSISPKHVIFKRLCKLHHIPYLDTTNCLWLLLITLFRCSPMEHLLACPLNMLQTSKLWHVEGNLKFPTCYKQKQLWGNPLTHFFCIGGILLLCKPIQWWCHLLQAPSFTPIAHAYVHAI